MVVYVPEQTVIEDGAFAGSANAYVSRTAN